MVSFEFEEVARCGSSYGVQGGIKFAGEEDQLERCLSRGFLFILMEDGSPVPFRIRSVDQKGQTILFLDTVDSPEKAKRLSDRPILLPLDEEGFTEKHLVSEELGVGLIGFTMYDEESHHTDVIADVLEYPGQWMAQMKGGQLIPLHDDLIVEIDTENKKITVSLASGIWSQDEM